MAIHTRPRRKPRNNPAALLDERDGARLRARFAAVGGRYAQLTGVEHAGFSDAGDNATVRKLVTEFFADTLLGEGASQAPVPGVTWNRVSGPAG